MQCLYRMEGGGGIAPQQICSEKTLGCTAGGGTRVLYEAEGGAPTREPPRVRGNTRPTSSPSHGGGGTSGKGLAGHHAVSLAACSATGTMRGGQRHVSKSSGDSDRRWCSATQVQRIQWAGRWWAGEGLHGFCIVVINIPHNEQGADHEPEFA